MFFIKICKNFINKKKPENGLNLRALGLLLLFLFLSIRPHAGVIALFMLVAPFFACRVAFLLVWPVIIFAEIPRLVSVILCPFTAFFVVFGFVPYIPVAKILALPGFPFLDFFGRRFALLPRLLRFLRPDEVPALRKRDFLCRRLDRGARDSLPS